MVEIHLHIQSHDPFPFLSIPLDDVQRLSIRPFKWLRYVMYSICGAHGDLSAVPDGPVVNYASTELVNDVIYYYTPSGNCIYVDCHGLNDQVTSSSPSNSPPDFRNHVLAHDGSHCVITGDPKEQCSATHLIPRSKCNEYIEKVIQVHAPLYDDTVPPIQSIDVVENGVLLRKDLCALLDHAQAAFLKTPNYGLDPADIRRVDLGPPCTEHYTLHHLEKPPRYDPAFAGTSDPFVAFGYGLNVDAQFQGTNSLPPAIILDYVYGVAAYKCWNSKRDARDIHGVMKNIHQEQYQIIPPLIPKRPMEDDPNGLDFNTNHPHWGLHTTGGIMAKAMDDLDLVMMRVEGVTPEEAAIRREKQMEEEELKVQEASRSKVAEWMKATDVVCL